MKDVPKVDLQIGLSRKCKLQTVESPAEAGDLGTNEGTLAVWILLTALTTATLLAGLVLLLMLLATLLTTALLSRLLLAALAALVLLAALILIRHFQIVLLLGTFPRWDKFQNPKWFLSALLIEDSPEILAVG